MFVRAALATCHTLQADSCASAVPGHTAAARATKVVKSRRRMARLLRTRIIRWPDPNTLRVEGHLQTSMIDRRVHTPRLLWDH
jgi:hypothetical protein